MEAEIMSERDKERGRDLARGVGYEAGRTVSSAM